MIKCILLNAHCTLIAEIVEVDAQLGDPNCKLINPYIINSIDDLTPWKSDITNQTEFMIRSENILTIADPNGKILDKYTELTS
tara:strand:+ start:359 stop:607 length:249 start_codon:yes stop_codon:yes gene_type:complete